MCSRYYFSDETIADVERLIGEPLDRFLVDTGDVHPSDEALIIASRDSSLTAEKMRWGFLGVYDSKQLMVNARAETALEKKSFRENVLN